MGDGIRTRIGHQKSHPSRPSVPLRSVTRPRCPGVYSRGSRRVTNRLYTLRSLRYYRSSSTTESLASHPLNLWTFRSSGLPLPWSRWIPGTTRHLGTPRMGRVPSPTRVPTSFHAGHYPTRRREWGSRVVTSPGVSDPWEGRTRTGDGSPSLRTSPPVSGLEPLDHVLLHVRHGEVQVTDAKQSTEVLDVTVPGTPRRGKWVSHPRRRYTCPDPPMDVVQDVAVQVEVQDERHADVGQQHLRHHHPPAFVHRPRTNSSTDFLRPGGRGRVPSCPFPRRPRGSGVRSYERFT